MNLISILLLVVNHLFFPLPQNVLGCAGVETSAVLGVPVDWEMVNALPDNAVERYFDVGNGSVWIVSSGHVFVFDLAIEEYLDQPVEVNGVIPIHPCGVYAFLSPTDKDILIDEYALEDNYDSWQEYWLATHESSH